ncbi:helix-turn-helix domain-containing protein [Polyangium sp. 6x1]|uniref:helix-turn-helix domain-containing protein n=1 Tax=Polyangium sp. 6x1 TaxID=3042689 RepID=UPI0032B1B41F
MNGSEIRQVRESLGLSQAQFASLLGVHAVTVSRWENSAQHPTPYQVGLIQQFGRAARRKDVATQVAAVLVTAGAIAGLYFLLKWALDEDEGEDDGEDAQSEPRGARRRPRRP